MDNLGRMRFDEEVLIQRQRALLERLQQLEDFQTTLQQLQSLDEETLSARVSLGCGISMQAIISEPHNVFVDIGLGIKVHCTSLEEALGLVNGKSDQLKKQMESITVLIGKIRASVHCTKGILTLLAFDNTHN